LGLCLFCLLPDLVALNCQHNLGKEFARLEMKLFAAKLLQGYDWSLLPQDLTLVMVPTPHPKEGLKVRFHREPLQGVQG
jgi:hypothetical protein